MNEDVLSHYIFANVLLNGVTLLGLLLFVVVALRVMHRTAPVKLIESFDLLRQEVEVLNAMLDPARLDKLAYRVGAAEHDVESLQTIVEKNSCRLNLHDRDLADLKRYREEHQARIATMEAEG